MASAAPGVVAPARPARPPASCARTSQTSPASGPPPPAPPAPYHLLIAAQVSHIQPDKGAGAGGRGQSGCFPLLPVSAGEGGRVGLAGCGLAGTELAGQL